MTTSRWPSFAIASSAARVDNVRTTSSTSTRYNADGSRTRITTRTTTATVTQLKTQAQVDREMASANKALEGGLVGRRAARVLAHSGGAAVSARLLVVSALFATRAFGGGFDMAFPLTDEREVVCGRLGSSPGDVSARGLFLTGTRADVPFTQAGGEVLLQGGLHFFQTSFGGIFGVEADLSLGGASSEKSDDGTVRDQRKSGGTAEERAQTKVWVTSRLGVRATLSLPVLQLSDHLAFRLGATGGLLLEANGSRSFEFSPAFVAGAELGFALGPVAGLASYLALPTQGLTLPATTHKLVLELGFGPIVVGGSVQFDEVAVAAARGQPPVTSRGQTIAVHAGYRFPQLNLR